MGTLLYKYPGELNDDEPELNAADIEDNTSKVNKHLDNDSDFSWSENSDGSNMSFSSEKLVDGY